MLTEIQKLEIPKNFLRLYEAGKIDGALWYVRENWLIYSHQPNWFFDNEQISEVAIGRHSYLSWHMSQRLQRDIPFFEKVFNQFSPYPNIALEMERDAFFMLAYANRIHGYSKATTKTDVSDLFPGQDIEHEFSVAQQLIAQTDKWRKWQLADIEECTCRLSTTVPELALFSYEYAYYWGYRNFTDEQRAQFC